jgi:transposase InsO family protein
MARHDARESGARVVDNALARDFPASRPNERWVTDITYVWTDEGWCYLAVILFTTPIAAASMRAPNTAQRWPSSA